MNLRRSLAVGVVLLSACVQRAPDPEPLVPAPKILSFEVTPTTVQAGDEVTLRWRLGDAVRMELVDSARGALASPPELTAGEVKVQVNQNTVFSLSAYNARGVRASRLASVRIEGASAREVLFSAFPEVIREGEVGQLIWSAPGATRVQVSDGVAPLDLLGQLESGSLQVNPTATRTTYTLEADGQRRSVTLTRAPVITVFEASKALGQQGEQVVLRWKDLHGTKVTLSADGRGDLATFSDAATVAEGSFTDALPPLVDGARVSYTLGVEGPGGQTLRKAVVIVGKQPAVIDATLPKYAKLGSTFQVTWRTQNADRVAIRANGATIYETLTRAEASTGALRLSTPSADTLYTVVALDSASGVEARRDLPLEIVGEVAITLLRATPDTAAAGCAPVTLTWKAINARRMTLLENGLITYSFREGKSAESGSITVYPNRARTTYELRADNTIDPAQTASVQVRNSAPASLKQVGGAVVFADQSDVNIDYSECTGGQAISGVAYTDGALQSGSTGFEDISTTGKEIEFADADNGVTAFQPVGTETFVMGNRRAGNWYAFINGYVIPGEPYYVYGYFYTYFLWYYNGNGIFPFGADLVAGSKGKVYWQQKGDQPNSYVVVQWNDMQVKNQPGSSLTFQAKIYQTGAIVFEYKDMRVTSNTFTHYTGAQATYVYGQPVPHVQGPFMQSVARYASTDPIISNRPMPLTVTDSSFSINEWRTQGAARAVASNLPFSGWVKVGQGVAQVPMDRFVPRGAFGINEVMYAPVSSVSAGEWLEVKNTSNVAIDMTGMALDFSANGSNVHPLAGSITVQPGKVVVFGQSRNAADNDNANVDYAYGLSYSMPDTSGTVRLLRQGTDAQGNPQTTVLSTATWTTSSGGASGRAVLLNQDQLARSSFTGLSTVTCGAVSNYGTRGQRGTPGALSSCFGYIMEPSITNTYYDISSKGTQAALEKHPGQFCNSAINENGYYTLSLGSDTFPYFGSTATDVTLHVGGWMYARRQVPTSTSCYQYIYTYPWPSFYSSYGYPTDRVMSLWGGYSYSYQQKFADDDGGGIFYRRVPANEDAANPAAHWVFQWHKLHPGQYYTSGEISFQAKIFDNGDIEYHYGAASVATPTYSGYPAWHEGADATIWLEGPVSQFSNFSGTSWALPYSLKNRVIIPGSSAVRFRRAAP